MISKLETTFSTQIKTFNIIVLNAATREKHMLPKGVEFNAELIAKDLKLGGMIT